VLDEWPVQPAGELDRFTTIASWRGGFGPVEHEGVRYGVKAHQFRRFIGLPQRVRAALEVALEIHPGDDADRRALEEHGWRLVDPAAASGNPDRFRAYVQTSGAELSVAQGIYVDASSGWFSDRTARYLASGRPALVQHTGFTERAGAAGGLLTFSTMDEAVDGANAIDAHYEEHCGLAREFAVRNLDASSVLSRFLEQAGVT